MQHLHSMLYFFSLVVHIKTLTPENSLECYLFSENHLVDLLKIIKMKWPLSRGAKSRALFCLYHFRMCAIALFGST